MNAYSQQIIHQAEHYEKGVQTNPIGQEVYQARDYFKLFPNFSTGASTGNTLKAEINPFWVELPPDPTSGGPNGDLSGEVGSIEGNFNVEANGSATFNVPIRLPAGIGGLSPQLGLAYYSMGMPYGNLGANWSINGLSAITRTSKTHYHNNGNPEPVSLNIDDQLELDGNKIFRRNGTDLVYYSENNTIDKIIYNYENDYFTVVTKAGLKKTYGGNNNSKLKLQDSDVVFSYNINRITDVNGNYIDFIYNNNPSLGEITINEIRYGGHLSSMGGESIPHSIKVKFCYSDMLGYPTIFGFPMMNYYSFNDLSERYYHTSIYHKLSDIKILYNDVEQKKYSLEYNSLVHPPNEYPYNTNVKLIRIKEFGLNGKKLNDLQFDWLYNNPEIDSKNIVLHENYYNEDFAGKYDFDGDGVKDFLFLTSDKKDGEFVIKSGNGAFSDYSITRPNNGYSISDVNNDGCFDLIVAEYTDAPHLQTNHGVKLHAHCFFRNSQGNLTYHSHYSKYENIVPIYSNNNWGSNVELNNGDFDGDGFLDILAVNWTGEIHLFLGDISDPIENESVATINPYTIPTLSNNQFADFDGDGKTDILCFLTGTTQKLLWLNQENNNFNGRQKDFFNQITPEGIICTDFNGDNKADILLFHGQTTDLFYSAGRSFIDDGYTDVPFDPDSPATYQVLDFDGDGFKDIILIDEAPSSRVTISSYKNISGFLIADITKTVNINSDDRLVKKQNKFVSNIVDLDSDGREELIFIVEEGVIVGYDPVYYEPIYEYVYGYHICFSDYPTYEHKVTNLISKITNSLGAEIEIEYGITGQTDHYEINEPAPSWPLGRYHAPMKVVTSVKNDNGAGGFFDPVDYYYSDAIYHNQGKGFLSFKKVVKKNRATKTETISKYGIYAPNTSGKKLYFRPYLKEQIKNYYGNEGNLGDDILISKVANTVSHICPDPSFPLSYYLYTQTMKTYNYELNSDNDLYRFSKVTKSYGDNGNSSDMIYWKFANIKQVKEFKGDDPTLPDSQQPFKEISEYTYFDQNLAWNAENPWIFGRLKDVEVTKKAPETVDIVRESSFTYWDNGTLKSECSDPTDENALLKEYHYDDYGNIIKTILKSNNPQLSGCNTEIINRTEYSPEYNYRFATKQINPLNDFLETIYEPVWGSAIEAKDANGLVVKYFYDDFGNLIKTVNTNGIEEHTALMWTEETDIDAPMHSLYLSWKKSSGNPTSVTYFDKLGRKLKTMTEIFNGQFSCILYSYSPITGRLTGVSEPYFPGETPVMSSIDYNIIGSVSEKTYPGENGDRNEQYFYEGLTERIVNAEGQESKRVYNAAGWVIETIDNNNNRVFKKYTAEGLVRETYVENYESETKILKEYYISGKLKKQDEPALGIYEYKYDPFGQLVEKKHNGVVEINNLQYDLLGRVTHQEEPGFGITDFYYDQGFKGKPDHVGFTNEDGESIDTYFTYDDYGQKTNERMVINACNGEVQESFNSAINYTVYGQVRDLVYPSGYSVTNKYTKEGFLKNVRDRSTGNVLWQMLEQNARGQTTKYSYGNNLITQMDFYPSTGYLEGITTYAPGGGSTQNVQDFTYAWDDIGNLSSRSKEVAAGNLSEAFDYDDLNRLTSMIVSVPSGSTYDVSMDYDALGRMQYKKSSNVNTTFHIANNFQYETTGNVYRLKSIDNVPLMMGESRSYSHTPFDKVEEIIEGEGVNEKKLHIRYGANHQRIIQEIYKNSQLDERRIYVGGGYQKVYKDGNIRELHFIQGGDGLAAIYTKSSNENPSLLFVHKDHLGSTQCLTDIMGNVVEEYSYDAWGNPRDPATWEPYEEEQQRLTNVGFTGQEHMEGFHLINMNGRVYDPITGLFLSPDPISGSPDFAQDFNPYVYCLNNPLSLVDPSGHSFLGINWGAIVMGIGSIFLNAIPGGFMFSVIAAITTNFITSTLNGADIVNPIYAGLSSACFSMLSAVTAIAVGEVFLDVGGWFHELYRAAAHGATQGLISVGQGGKFIHGLFSASLGSISHSAMSILEIKEQGYKIAVSAAVGGTASVVSGGSFANGAVTSAFTVIYNHELHKLAQKAKVARSKAFGLVPWKGARIKDRNYALRYLQLASEISGKEVSMFLLEDGSYWVNPWEANGNTQTSSYDKNNKWTDSYGNICNTETDQKILAQYHYGPATSTTPFAQGLTTIGSRNDANYAYYNNITVYHIGKDNTFVFRAGFGAYIDHELKTQISTEKFMRFEGAIWEHQYNAH